MSIEEAIRRIHEVLSSDYHYDETIGYQLTSDDFDWLNMAIAALRAQQEVEKNEPLTLEELQEMDGEPVWLEEVGHDGYGEWDICYGVTGLGGEDPLVWFSSDFLSVKNYGVTWIAYRRKMKEG